ncbi:MAG: nucleic acid-binding protein [Epulopiscium sp. Nele67-Bin005]|nr:MAG: nucleic acid-binding protein [Epulopiscium sp. Nele67-Bin005]
MKQKKSPLRKCTGCGEMKSKVELVRVVRSNEGQFSMDFVGKKAGRGAYICKNIDCLLKAEKTRGLERSFKMAVSKEIYEELKQAFNYEQ